MRLLPILEYEGEGFSEKVCPKEFVPSENLYSSGGTRAD